MKTCTICKHPKDLDDFVKDKCRPDGRGSRCLLCERERVKAWNRTPEGAAYNIAYNSGRPVDHKDHYARYRVQITDRVRETVLNNTVFIDDLKNRPCADCEGTFLAFCMDWDHVRGLKIRNISRMKTSNREGILAEIAKCDLVCANCHRLRTDARMVKSTVPWKARLRAKLDALKTRPCADCCETFPPGAMQFDHVRGEKEASIGSMFGWAWQRILDEVAKCEVVCSVCHRLRTKARQAAA